jgi:hypothetical protein
MDKNYEKPRVEDYGDLKELTAATRAGVFTDATYGPGKNVTTDPVLTTNPG